MTRMHVLKKLSCQTTKLLAQMLKHNRLVMTNVGAFLLIVLWPRGLHQFNVYQFSGVLSPLHQSLAVDWLILIDHNAVNGFYLSSLPFKLNEMLRRKTIVFVIHLFNNYSIVTSVRGAQTIYKQKQNTQFIQ